MTRYIQIPKAMFLFLCFVIDFTLIGKDYIDITIQIITKIENLYN